MTEEPASLQPLHALVAVSDTSTPDVRAILDFIARTWPEHEASVVAAGGHEGNVLSFDVDDHRVLLAFEPQPIPVEELEGPVAAAWYWPAAAVAFRRQRGYATVTLAGGEHGGALERATILTRLAAAVAATTNAVGILWEPGAIVHEPLDFIETARRATEDAPPVNLWVHFSMHGRDDRRVLFTIGLAAFGLREIEAVAKPDARKGELVATVLGVASYVLTRGDIIKEGDMVDAGGRKVKARFGKSSWEREGEVMILDLA
jgi:hypothetical protein